MADLPPPPFPQDISPSPGSLPAKPTPPITHCFRIFHPDTRLKELMEAHANIRRGFHLHVTPPPRPLPPCLHQPRLHCLVDSPPCFHSRRGPSSLILLSLSLAIPPSRPRGAACFIIQRRASRRAQKVGPIIPQTACRHEAQPPLFPAPPAPLHAGHEPGEAGLGGGRGGGAWRHGRQPRTDRCGGGHGVRSKAIRPGKKLSTHILISRPDSSPAPPSLLLEGRGEAAQGPPRG